MTTLSLSLFVQCITIEVLIKHSYSFFTGRHRLRITTSYNNMYNKTKKTMKRESRKTKFGIKLPPIEVSDDSNFKTILDVDPDFYSLIEGRPIRPSTSIKKYKQNIKDIALKKTLNGFISDEILRINREIETERNIYETAYKHFEEYQNSFDKFLADDNNNTILVMKKSDNLAKDLANQSEEHKKVSYEMASLKSKLQYIDETLLILLSFENFLHKTAPMLWLENQRIELSTKHSEIFIMDSDIFQKIKIDLIREKLNILLPPRLYFKTPEQLIRIFEILEKQNLNYLLITEELHSHTHTFLKSLDNLKNLLTQECNRIQHKITKIEEIITWNEIRETELKEIFYKILGQKIKYLVSSETVLQIYNYVEYAYEQLIAPNDTKLDFLHMALALESEYDNLTLNLSVFDLNIIKEIETETNESEVIKIKQAREAAQVLKNVNKLSKRLKVSYEPSRRRIQE